MTGRRDFAILERVALAKDRNRRCETHLLHRLKEMNDHSNQQVDDDPQSSGPRLIGLWPLVLYFTLCMILASNQEWVMWIVEELVKHTRDNFKGRVSEHQVLSGFHFGQAMGVGCVLTLIAGFCGQNAIRSIALASLLAVAIFLTLMYDMERTRGQGRYSELFYSYNLPLMVFGAAIPLLAARAISGAVITRQKTVDFTRRLSVESLLQLTTVVACLIFYCRVPMQLHRLTVTQVLPYLPGLLAMATLASLITVLPSVRWAFQSRFNWARWLLLAVISGLGISVLCGGYSVLLGSWLGGGGGFRFGLIATLVSVACFLMLYLLGIVALRTSGYRWQKSSAAPAPSLPVGSDWPKRRSGWIWTGGFLLAAVSTTLPIQALKRYEKNRFEESIQWLTRLRSDGGDANWYESIISSVKVPSTNTRYWIDEAIKLPHLYQISLAGTEVGDREVEQLIRNCPDLGIIDLSDTNITDRTVELMETLSSLRSVNLSRTAASPAAIGKLLSKKGSVLYEVTLEDMQLSDEQFSSLFSPQVSAWGLAGNNLTEKTLIQAYQNTGGNLDISRNPGSINTFALLNGPVPPNYITIDQVNMDDALVDQWLAKGPSETVYLGRTSITVNGLIKLMETFSVIGFLPGGFDERTLSNLSPTVVPRGITLRDPALSGDFLICWPVLPAWLDVSGSSFSDAQLSKLAERVDWRPGSLNVCGCQITDASLPLLSKSKPEYLDLRDTQVTFQGLMSVNFSNTRVILEPEKFTYQQMEQLKNRSTYVFQRHPVNW